MRRKRARSIALLLLAAVSVPVVEVAAQEDRTSPFIVRPGSILRIQGWPEIDYGGDFPVEESGVVYVPVLGAVEVGGKSLDEVRTILRAGYARSMREPVVTVIPLFKASVLRDERSIL